MYVVDGDGGVVDPAASATQEEREDDQDSPMNCIIRAYNEGFAAPELRRIAEEYADGSGEEFEVDIRPIVEEIRKKS